MSTPWGVVRGRRGVPWVGAGCGGVALVGVGRGSVARVGDGRARPLPPSLSGVRAVTSPAHSPLSLAATPSPLSGNCRVAAEGCCKVQLRDGVRSISGLTGPGNSSLMAHMSLNSYFFSSFYFSIKPVNLSVMYSFFPNLLLLSISYVNILILLCWFRLNLYSYLVLPSLPI